MPPVQAGTLFVRQRRNPLRNIPVNTGREIEEIPHLFPISMIDLDDIHGLVIFGNSGINIHSRYGTTGAQVDAPRQDYADCSICAAFF
jgi:hypothetical protein